MKYFWNFINRACLKELLKNDIFSRTSLSLKIVSSMLILAPISWIATIILPGWLSILARIVFYLVLLITFFAIVFEFKILDYSSKIEKAIEYNFSLFLKYIGLQDSNLEHRFLIHQIEKVFVNDYIRAILDTNVLFSSIKDIKYFDFKTGFNYNLRLKVLYQDIVKIIENYNQKKAYKSYNKTYKQYENKTYNKNKEFIYSNDYEKALNYFNLSSNFSKDDLKKAYRKKIKEVHPDSGGSKEKFLIVQKYFEILENSI